MPSGQLDALVSWVERRQSARDAARVEADCRQGHARGYCANIRWFRSTRARAARTTRRISRVAPISDHQHPDLGGDDEGTKAEYEYREFPGATHGSVIEQGMPDIFAFFKAHTKK